MFIFFSMFLSFLHLCIFWIIVFLLLLVFGSFDFQLLIWTLLQLLNLAFNFCFNFWINFELLLQLLNLAFNFWISLSTFISILLSTFYWNPLLLRIHCLIGNFYIISQVKGSNSLPRKLLTMKVRAVCGDFQPWKQLGVACLEHFAPYAWRTRNWVWWRETICTGYRSWARR